MTREEVLTLLQEYIEAELAVLKGKSVSLNGQTMTMADLSDIRSGRERLDKQLKEMENPRRLFSLARFT